ncbi:MAG TPA: YbhB/YbcL family Raf kinase inhibitor-like protein [Candidatus Acidoferrales bacterium]|nr:YbhB/YbcL family Raf kinase inhibitor-like protein [Candidatus Acidoferrales bacterium]
MSSDQFVVSSPSISSNGPIPEKHYWNDFGCTGGNISPGLKWSGAPKETKSFAITVYDSDAPTGSGFWHWVAYNFPANVTSLEEGAASLGNLPAGVVEGNTDLGKPGWFGPCPPPGRVHHYHFTVHALKTEKLELPSNATAAFVGFMLWQNTIAKAMLTGTGGPRK